MKAVFETRFAKIGETEQHYGGIRSAVVDCASAMFLAHNHPSGDPTPSPVDRDVTRRLNQVAAIVGIRILDHLIIGDTVLSMAENGSFS